MPQNTPLFLGLRARTARAIAVALEDAGDEGPRVVLREEIRLWDPRVPDSRQPHHAGLDLEAPEAARVVARAERAVSRAAERALARLARDLARSGRLVDVAVVGSEVDPARIAQIANPHIRAHAAEGWLFRDVLERAAASREIPCRAIHEKSAWDEAAAALGCTAAALRRHTARLGQPVGPPWRADEKLACLAALVAHAGGGRPK